ncbi:SDR family NAD(P)-dependent oxidoreductase [Algimonas arctica]|uniref:SDR family NAD(P)-dependent oxidoreductase n=1 Tax=Algimonas arctica TaxID=1479486 RepID=UPI0016795D08|nr:SDR family NAD(P)-dependent oxidoreductase [Algimonas arctica]
MRPRVTLQLPAAPCGHAHSAVFSLHGASVLLLGYGYVARALAPVLVAAGARVQFTTRRNSAALGDAALQFDTAAMRTAFAAADIVLSSVAPSKDGYDPALVALENVQSRAAWIGYLSATSVYGDRDGQWAFEGEAPAPSLPRGTARADAELSWLETHPATQVFRLAGIYGPGRAPFERIRSDKARIIDAPNHVVNRIHIDDIVTAIMASIAQPSPQDIFNIADGQPAAPGEVMAYAAQLIGCETPPTVALNDPSVSAMARSFYAETKRIDISRAKTRLEWEPRFSNYKLGLNAILSAELKAAV